MPFGGLIGGLDGVVSVQPASRAPGDGVEETAGRRALSIQQPEPAVCKGRSADFFMMTPSGLSYLTSAVGYLAPFQAKIPPGWRYTLV